MEFLSEKAEEAIVERTVEAVLKALEVTTKSKVEEVRYLQPNQAIVYADISKQTLNRWVVDKGLPQAKIGGIVLYDKKDLDEFIAKYKL